MTGLILEFLYSIICCKICDEMGDWGFAWSVQDQNIVRYPPALNNVDSDGIEILENVIIAGPILLIPNQLFYVSHAVSEDAMNAFYSENTFDVECHCGLLSL